jgi:glycosyltransferase involved in cell wall biosynthesis
MRITIVMGFFLPMPPAAGGATEKSWDGLAREFARRGHQVTVISRSWPDWPDREQIAGVTYLRLRGYSHTPRLRRNLWRDFLWSARVGRALPAADITVVNCIALPVWLGWFRRRSGRIVVMPGRMPKGQYRLYRRVDRVLAVSNEVRSAVLAENSRLAPVTTVSGYPIDWTTLATNDAPTSPTRSPLTIGFVGRIHREKGLDLLVAALERLSHEPSLPPWRVLLCGPSDVARGGSGADYLARIDRTLAAFLPRDRFEIRPPVFDPVDLAHVYRSIDLFCYPSVATRGETFGVAVAEAMAAGCVPVVSRLPCFLDFVRPDENGVVFDHDAANAPAQLASALTALLADPERRRQFARAARADTRRYDYPEFAEGLLADFSTLM